MSAYLLVLPFLFIAFSSSSAMEFNQASGYGTIIGKVFNDANNNGIQDVNEYGIPGIRLVTVSGLIIETDGYGRYNIPDNNISIKQSNNFILKIDVASLPIGSKVQSENPRLIRLSKGSMNKINFAITY